MIDQKTVIEKLLKSKDKWLGKTPCFVLDVDKFNENFKSIKDTLRGEVVYSYKTNPDPQIVDLVNKHGNGFLLASVEESEVLCSLPNVPREKLIFQSPSLNAEQFNRLKKLGVKRFVIDSFDQLDMMIKDIQESDKLELLVRINTGVSVGKPELSYGFDSCLGFPLSDAKIALKQLNPLRQKGIIKLGIHNHHISQNIYLRVWKNNISVITKLVREAYKDGIILDTVDFGGGYPIQYKSSVPPLATIAKTIGEGQKKMSALYPNMHYIFEPGRKSIGESVVLIAKIAHTKEFNGKNIAILDSSLYNTSPDTLFVGLHLPLAILTQSNKGNGKKKYTLRGNTPDSLDVFERNIEIPHLENDDHLAFLHAGAYNFYCDFISLKKPEHILI